MNLRYPELNAPDADGKLRQLQSYLFQLVDILNIGFSQQETAAQEVKQATVELAKTTPKTPLESFDAIKGLIIKSADIVEAYGEKIDKTLVGKYVAISDFGTYTEDQLASMSLSATSLRSAVASVQTISGDVSLIREEVSRLEQKADAVEIQIAKVESDGVKSVNTGTGYTFDANGLKISKDGEPLENKLDNTGMYVTFSGATILQANGNGVVGKDVTVKNYLIVGDHARFEDYGNDRTACFYYDGGDS